MSRVFLLLILRKNRLKGSWVFLVFAKIFESNVQMLSFFLFNDYECYNKRTDTVYLYDQTFPSKSVNVSVVNDYADTHGQWLRGHT